MKLSDFYPNFDNWVSASSDSAGPKPQIPDSTTQVNPFLAATVPLPLQYSPDSLRQYNRPGLSSFRVSPLSPSSFPSINSASASVTKTIVQNSGSGLLLKTNGIVNPNQSVANFQGTGLSITSDSSGNISFVSTATGDGITHGTLPWEYDSAYVILRDDFSNLYNGSLDPANVSAQIGELGWISTFASGITTPQTTSYVFPYFGTFSWENSTSANSVGGYIINSVTINSAGVPQVAWPLLDYPGWKLTFVWKVDSSTQFAFSKAKKSLYVGLCGNFINNLANGVGRPDVFMGVRYDTSATPGTLTLSSVATSSGGNATYTGTITGGANGAYNGITFTVSGFTNGVNNGTFVCVGSSTTTLTLANASAVAESHAATASGTGLNDTNYTFEVVSNRSYTTGSPRHNLQGQTFITPFTPTQGTWYRLEITSTAVGQVTISMTDGNQIISQNFTVPLFTILTNGAITAGASITSVGTSTNIGLVSNSPLSATSNVLTNASAAPFGPGSKVTFANLPGAASVLNGQTVTLIPNADSSNRNLTFNTTIASFASTNLASNSSVIGYPAYQPYFAFGNDDTTSPAGGSMRFFMDYFSFVWNPNFGPNAPGVPNSVKPRYW